MATPMRMLGAVVCVATVLVSFKIMRDCSVPGTMCSGIFDSTLQGVLDFDVDSFSSLQLPALSNVSQGYSGQGEAPPTSKGKRTVIGST